MIDLEPWLKGVAEQEMQDDANMRVHISEMLSLVAFMCERGPDWKGKVVLYAGDNSTVRQWVCRRQSGLRAGKLLIRVINLCEMNYGFTLVGAWWRTYHNTDSDFITRCEDDEFGEFLEKKGWDNVSLGPAICQAIEDTDRFGPCFSSWKDPEDRRVMMQLKEKRMKRFIDRPVGIPWERLEVVELAVEDRWVKDFELLARQHVMDHVGEIKVVVATLPVDKKGKIVAEFNKQLTDQKPQIVVWEGPRNGPWEAAARGMIEVGLQPVQFEFVSTELGELLARRRTCLVATSFGASEDLAKRCLVRTVTAPPLGTCLQRAPHGLDLIWKKPCRLTIEPGIPRDPLLPQVVGHAWDVPEGERKNVHGLAGPGRWPLRKENGEFEKIEVYDRFGRPGHLRQLARRERKWHLEAECAWNHVAPLLMAESPSKWRSGWRRTLRAARPTARSGCISRHGQSGKHGLHDRVGPHATSTSARTSWRTRTACSRSWATWAGWGLRPRPSSRPSSPSRTATKEEELAIPQTACSGYGCW